MAAVILLLLVLGSLNIWTLWMLSLLPLVVSVKRSLSFPSVVGPTYVGPGGRLPQRPIGGWMSGECLWQCSPWFCRFSKCRKGSAVPLRAERVPDEGAGRSSWERSLASRV